jgi:hypothetical protein
MASMLERIRMGLRGETPPPPIAELIGSATLAEEETFTTLELKIT